MKMIPLALVSSLFLLLSLRLFRTGRESDGEERWLAGFFCSIAVALPLRLIAVEAQLANVQGATTLNILGHLMMSLSTICVLMFIWRVFRPTEAWAEWGVYAMCSLQLALIPAVVLLNGHRDETQPIVLFANITRALPFLWAFGESRRYHGLMVKRVNLGLADPVVANRFTLFSLWTGALFVLPSVAVAMRIFLSGMGLEEVAAANSGVTLGWILGVMRATIVTCGSVASVAIWLSFFPPQFYTRRLAARDSH
jgi:hypothetical protein